MAQCFISIGSNINREHNIRSAIDSLQHHFGPLICSSIYESTAVGFNGAAFYNLVSQLDSPLEPDIIAQQLKAIEHQHGRLRSEHKFCARTLDLDLLLYDQHIIQSETLKLPHHDILQYAFVLEPLAEIAPQHQHPLKQLSYAKLWADFDKNQVQQHKISLPQLNKERPPSTLSTCPVT